MMVDIGMNKAIITGIGVMVGNVRFILFVLILNKGMIRTCPIYTHIVGHVCFV